MSETGLSEGETMQLKAGVLTLIGEGALKANNVKAEDKAFQTFDNGSATHWEHHADVDAVNPKTQWKW